MGIKNLALSLAAVSAMAGTPDTTKKAVGSNNDQIAGKAVPTQVDQAGEDTRSQVEETLESNDEIIAKIKEECPDHAAMLAQKEPELYAMLKADHPEMLQASIVGDLLGVLGTLIKGLYGLLGAEGTIIVAILIAIFGVIPVVKGGIRGGIWIKDGLTGKKSPDEEGEVIPQKDLPALKDILSEVVADSTVAINNLTPAHQKELNDYYDYLTDLFDNLCFKNKAEGIKIFVLLIKAKYLELRIGELHANTTHNATLDTELTALTTIEKDISQALADNPINVSAIRKGREKYVRDNVRGSVRTALGEKGVKEMVAIPRIHNIGSSSREIKVLENKLKIWLGRYNQSLSIAGPGRAAPNAAVSTTVRKRYEQAAAFIAIYEGLRTNLRRRLEARSWLEMRGHTGRDILPVDTGRRAFAKGALAVGGFYGIKYAAQGAEKVMDIINPPEPPASEVPSEADEVEDRLEDETRRGTQDDARKASDEMDDSFKSAKDRPDDF